MKLADLAGDIPPSKSADENFEAKMQLKTWPALRMMVVDFPKSFIDEVNVFIDEIVIPDNKDYGHSLIGQIRQDEKSKQLAFPLEGHEFAVEFKKVLNNCATAYIQKSLKRQSVAEAFESWTVHSYAGDYNPRHSHGCNTTAGLSSLMWLKVPDSIKDLKPDSDAGLHHASGVIDGWTQFSWGLHSSQDIFRLKEQTQEAMQPVEGKFLIWPNWLDHEVFPFFSEGERRTFVANFNIFDSMEEKQKYSNVLKEHLEQRNSLSPKDRKMEEKVIS